MSLAQNLKLARIKKGYKQEELAKLVGKSKNVISNWERGDNKPDADTLFDLCDILGVDANYLLGWENNQNLSLSIKEQEHIKKFRSLDSYGKKQVNAVLNNEYTRVQEQSMQIEVLHIHMQKQNTSLGFLPAPVYLYLMIYPHKLWMYRKNLNLRTL